MLELRRPARLFPSRLRIAATENVVNAGGENCQAKFAKRITL